MIYDEKEVAPELNYLKLKRFEDCEANDSCSSDDGDEKGRSFWWWIKLILGFTCLMVLGGVFVKWVGPYFMDKDIIPIINWETTTFCPRELAVIIFASVALFPTLLLPSSPSMWVAGMTFGYGIGFLLIFAGAIVGVSLPYFTGSLFYHKIQGWLEKYPKKASIIRLAGDGNWISQCRAVTLIRISPFPYIIYNYCAVSTNVQYGPYIIGSLLGMIPEIFVTLYTGTLIRALADASYERHTLSAPQIILNVLGFIATATTTIICTLYAKRKLRELQNEEEPLLE